MYKLSSTWGGKGIRFYCREENAPKKGDVIPLTHHENGEKVKTNWKIMEVRPTCEHWAGTRVDGRIVEENAETEKV